jgi:serine/threonine protein phosphatase PrpC
MRGSDILIGALSDIGNVRKINEDFLGYYIDKKKALYIVADGMGGHNAGEIASKAVVENTIEFINSNEMSLQDPASALRNAIIYANKKIYDLSSSSSGLSGMGTTITAVLIVGQDIYVANVGDSSCYIIKNHRISKVTKDHSLVQELIDEGSITEEQAKKHPNKNIITRAVGTNEAVVVDIFELTRSDVDKIILCTDGLSNEVTAEEMLEYAHKYINSTACEELIHLAKVRGGRDNISVMIFEGVDDHDRDDTRG